MPPNAHDFANTSVYSRKGGVDLYLHTFVMWTLDWGWIEHTLNSRRSPLETEVFSLSHDFANTSDQHWTKLPPKQVKFQDLSNNMQIKEI